MFDLVFRAPPVAAFFRRLGAVPASVANANAALDRDATVLVYPGGDWEACRPFHHRHRVDFHGHRGFIRLALQRRVPVVPIASHGSHESLIILTRGEQIARMLQLHRLRVNVFPIVAGVPFGIAPIVVPYVPFPSAVTVSVLPALDWHTRFDADAAHDDHVVAACYEEITSVLQDELSRMAGEDRFGMLHRRGTASR
jgi:1-acyl-sn-glycerol-3-phosphate acyltransferase